jgi:hypothetical protein
VNEKLRKLYAKRASIDPQIKYLKKRIQLSEEIKSTSTLSLNLEVRKSQKTDYEKTELEIENEYLEATGKKPVEKIDRPDNQMDKQMEDSADILMQQTHIVMADMIRAAGEFDLVW